MIGKLWQTSRADRLIINHGCAREITPESSVLGSTIICAWFLWNVYIYIYLDYISNLYKYIYISLHISKKQLDIWYMDILCGVWCRIQRGSEQFRFVLRILFEARLGIMMTYLHDSLLCMASMVMSWEWVMINWGFRRKWCYPPNHPIKRPFWY
jgi:hypothetical protein